MDTYKSRLGSIQSYFKNGSGSGSTLSGSDSEASSISNFRFFSSSKTSASEQPPGSQNNKKNVAVNNLSSKGDVDNDGMADDHDDDELGKDQQSISGDDEDDEDDEDSDYDSELEQIGRFSFGILRDSLVPRRESPGLMSLDHYNWLIQRYLPWGEPQGIVPAREPHAAPPIQPIDQDIKDTELSKKPDHHEGHHHHHRIRIRRANDPSHSQSPSTDVSEVHVLSEQELRQKILEIAALGLPDKERDRKVQRLMTDNYYKIRGLVVSDGSENSDDEDEDEETEENDSMNRTTEKDKEIGMNVSDSTHRTNHHHHHHSTHKLHEENLNLQLNIDSLDEETLKPTYTPEGYLGCDHYSRKCKVQCPDCNKFYTCRLCHDSNEEDHQMSPSATKAIMCMNCKELQAPSDTCKKCGVEFGRYYCSMCKLWENDELGDKPIYHCDDCGICRIGEGLGKDFFHCKTCNICMALELENNHKCIENSTECDCPICGEFMFTSRETVVFMKCGHPIHQLCYEKHVKTSFKCPTCARTIINMAARFRILDTEIATTAMPEPYCRWKSIIVCNDCFAKSSINYHILGLKCGTCGSYNTAQVSLIKPEDVDNNGEHPLHRPHVDEVAEGVDSLLDMQDSDSDSSEIL